MAGVNGDNFLWIVIYRVVPDYVTFRLDPSVLSQAQLAIFSDVLTRIKPPFGYNWRKSKAVGKRSILLLPVLLLSRVAPSWGCRWTITDLSARFTGAGSLPCCPRKMRFLTGLFLLIFPCPSTIPAVGIQESLSMLSRCSLLLFLGFACRKILFIPEGVICSVFVMAPINTISSAGVTYCFHGVTWGFRNVYILVGWYTCAAAGVEKWGICVWRFSRKWIVKEFQNQNFSVRG